LPCEALIGTGASIWEAEEDQSLPRKEVQCSARYRVMLGLKCVYRRVKDIVKEVNRKACAGPAEGGSLPAPCSIFLLFLLQLICKT